jgi:hypothetical protein
MTAPSVVLECIARTLDSTFAPAAPTIDTPRVYVLISDILDENVSQEHTFTAPAIVVSCAGFTELEAETGLYRASFLARCYARVPRGPAVPVDSSGDVAMDLAVVVARVVDQTIWEDESGLPVVARRAERLQVRNRTTRQVHQAEGSLWLVTWEQLLEIAPADLTGILRAFRHLHIQFAMGTADTPDVGAIVELEGGTPP